ncbi:protein disabled isoform X2 [Harmonia axyridis]|uniref:protein disabled isoform X2 n=1 Tax=Harmonia axyridis TaxID=115357 RepID=UPI001E27515B|nr:protein disabled isoform X2 [Harmonia axyridis]
MGMKKLDEHIDKHDTSRFGGEGQCFKAKLIGILEVSEARGDRMCQEALSDLKMAIRAAGEHKQRITVHIALDGLRLRDEKTGDCLYHHPVHKISFIAQDMTDSRAFGYIFGSPDTGHRFFGIKTDKAASQVVIAMRDLFQVVFALKRKEIELAKQHLEKNCLYNSPLFSDSSSNKSVTPELPAKYEAIKGDSKTASNSVESKMSGTAVANLVDLQLELNSLQQGLNQMEKITPSEPFGSKDDPFGDSFTSFPNPILPPPPSSGKERGSRTSDSSNLFSPKTPHTGDSLATSSGLDTYSFQSMPAADFKFSRDFSSSHEEPSSGEWFTPSNSLFEETTLLSDTAQKTAKDEKLEQTKKEILSQFDVFTDLDPLGTGRSKPYIDKKHFFQELKNPPKKVLNDLVQQTESKEKGSKLANLSTTPKSLSDFETDPFGEDPFVSLDPFAETEFKQDPFEKDFNEYKKNKIDVGFLSRPLSKSPNTTALSSLSLTGGSFKNVQFKDSVEGGEVKDETAPEPPPRPDTALLQIKPPPLPPKKQANDLLVKPPPRPPHIEDSLYGYLDNNYATVPSVYTSSIVVERSPALPIPMRKSRFDSDSIAPERPVKGGISQSFEDDYLTPIQFSKPGEYNAAGGALLLPSTNLNKSPINTQNITVTSNLNSRMKEQSNIPDSLSNSLDGLDITLSQLTLSGLNELAVKLNIPTSQLSNMTLVQLTEYLSNVIKAKSEEKEAEEDKQKEEVLEFPAFQADFETNFDGAKPVSGGESYDRYAVFRELINEEIKQTKIDTEPQEFKEVEVEKPIVFPPMEIQSPMTETKTAEDRYAALREIVEEELMKTENKIIEESPLEENDVEQSEKNTSIVQSDGKKDKEGNESSELKVDGSLKDGRLSPPKSPSKFLSKSPISNVITEIIQTTRLNSGSLSDIISGSSPEVDNMMESSEAGNKQIEATGESWAIFDQTNTPQESVREKQAVQSEEGLSWSSDSKDGNGSPSDYRKGPDSESGGDRWPRKSVRKDQEGWWDTSAEPEMPYSSSNRRSTDSYDDEYYECYERPRRRRQGGWGAHGGQVGGHSSSSRDVSPWEEEPKRREPRESRSAERLGWSRPPKPQQFDRYRERRPTDSWDEEDEYEYDDPRKFHWSEKYNNREPDRFCTGGRDIDNEPRTRWNDEERRRRRRRESERDHRCCPDWEEEEHDKPSGRYSSSGRWSSASTPPGPGKWRERKHDDRYYSREESPWEDEYPLEKEEAHPPPHYMQSKRNWKRPNSASEMERKIGDFKSRHLAGSDGERDKRYKGNRRSRSRDSQYSEPAYRHKPDTGSLTRNKPTHGQYAKPSQFETDFAEPKKQPDIGPISDPKKTFTLQSRKKKEDRPKAEENTNTFPRKSSKPKQGFDNNFEDGPMEIPMAVKTAKLRQQLSMIELQRKVGKDAKPRPYQGRSKSLFEDDFSMDKVPEDNSISVIKEELTCEEGDSFEFSVQTSNRLSKRLSGVLRADLKKSESVNIFGRENDPFDDDFFCEEGGDVRMFDTSDKKDLKNGDSKWTDD